MIDDHQEGPRKRIGVDKANC